jgi:hypothetical protein
MPNVTLAVPEELHKIMKKHPEIKWTEIARNAMKQYATRLQVLEDITSKSKLSEKDAEEIGDSVKRDLASRYRKAIAKKKALSS